MKKIDCDFLDIHKIYDSGQVFNWDKLDDGYIFSLKDKIYFITDKNRFVEISDINEDVIEYFDLDTDYELINSKYNRSYKYVKEAIDYSYGIRILRQDPFEILITFLISQNNNIKRIKKSVDLLKQKHGKKVKYNNKYYYCFPTVNELKNVDIETYKSYKLGYRDKYIYNTIKKIIDENIDIYAFNKLSDEDLYNELIKFMGVGKKVAHCIMLFGYGRKEVFPVDTWIKKLLENVFNVKSDYHDFINKKFKYQKGVIQQYLFYYIREDDGNN